jgi:hypothetical protein
MSWAIAVAVSARAELEVYSEAVRIVRVKRIGPKYMLKLVLLNTNPMDMLHRVVHSTWDA